MLIARGSGVVFLGGGSGKTHSQTVFPLCLDPHATEYWSRHSLFIY